MKKFVYGVVCVACCMSISFAQPPMGAEAKKDPKEQKQFDALKGTIKGQIVWSTSRSAANHDLWIMNADGTEPRQLTKGDNVDWYPRFSPDGSKIIFTRSKSGWLAEVEAENNDKWDTWTINADGTDEKKVADNAVWATWRPDGLGIVFARGSQVFIKDLASGKEDMIFDGATTFKKGTFVQQPELSADGKFIAITLRGASRETGIWSIEKKVWNTTGGGCQVDWLAGDKEVYRVNPTGNGGTAAPSEILIIPVQDGKPTVDPNANAKLKLMDLPGRRSHEYFPKFDQTGEYMVWCATDKGHDHDLYDYEMYIWKKGADVNSAARITFHTGNDRWPDIHLVK